MKKQKNHSRIYKIDGVGVNLERFHPVSAEEKSAIRAELGYNTADFIITVVAELNKNKNQIMLVRKTAELKAIIPTLKILLIGKETLPIVRDYVSAENLSDTVQFLGYRSDVDKLTMISDIAFSASLREGLPVNIIEAMACGIPVVASDNRGHRSLVRDKETGFIFSPKSEKEMIDNLRDKISKLNNIMFSDNEWNTFFSEVLVNKNEGIVEKSKSIQEDFVKILKKC